MAFKEQDPRSQMQSNQEITRQFPLVSFRMGRLNIQVSKQDGEVIGVTFELGDVGLGNLLEDLIDEEDKERANPFFSMVIAPMRKKYGTPEMTAQIRIPGRHESQLQRFLGEDPSTLSQVIDELNEYNLQHEELSEAKKEFLAGVIKKLNAVVEKPKESDDLSRS